MTLFEKLLLLSALSSTFVAVIVFATTSEAMDTLKFYPVKMDPKLLADHQRRGGRELRRTASDIADGQLRVMSGSEPFGKGGAHGLHVSISVGKPDRVEAFRAPTDEECSAALTGLFRQLRFEEDTPPGADQFIRHWWEVGRS